MNLFNANILTINAGSSSIKFALYQLGDAPESVFYGQVDRIDLSGTWLSFQEATGKTHDSHHINKHANNCQIDLL